MADSSVAAASPGGRDDPSSAAAIGSLAFISATMAHETLGHGSLCLALGGRAVVYPVSMQCTVESPILVAGGPLLNVAAGVTLWIILKHFRSLSVHLRYLLWLAMAFNLFNAAGYFGLGVATGFGDWGVLLGTLTTSGKAGLALLAAALYYGFMRAVASAGFVFLGCTDSGAARGARLTLFPYIAAGVVACAAALLAPLGRSYVWVGAAASFGAGLGLLAIHDWGTKRSQPEAAPPLTRSFSWLGASLIITALFVFFIGRGLKLAP